MLTDALHMVFIVCGTWQPGMFKVERVERFDFYERARNCYAVVATGETAKYGNIILVKGVLGASEESAEHGPAVFRL